MFFLNLPLYFCLSALSCFHCFHFLWSTGLYNQGSNSIKYSICLSKKVVRSKIHEKLFQNISQGFFHMGNILLHNPSQEKLLMPVLLWTEEGANAKNNRDKTWRRRTRKKLGFCPPACPHVRSLWLWLFTSCVMLGALERSWNSEMKTRNILSIKVRSVLQVCCN